MLSTSKENEFISALRSRDLWLYLAWQDIRLRYRRSIIGPFWITLSQAIFCLSLGVVYSQLFKINLKEYLPFLSTGYVIWGFISGSLSEFPNTFLASAAYIKDMKINLLAILFRVSMRQLITLGHNIIIVVAIYFIFGINPGWVILMTLPGLLLLFSNIFALGVIISILGARFRDVPQIIQSLIQVVFFVTPITWTPRLLPENSWIVNFNPFAGYIDITRSPLLGTAPSQLSWLISLFTLLLFSLGANYLYKLKVSRIPFWV